MGLSCTKHDATGIKASPTAITIHPKSGKKEDYRIGKSLGRGHFAEVRECEHKASGRKYAVKIIEKESLNVSNMDDILAEIEVLKRAGNHSNIVALVDNFQDDHEFYIVMELCTGGDLFARIVNEGKLSESSAADYCRQLAEALVHIHSCGITHRDLKPENILLVSKEPESAIKIADFGLSKIINGAQSTMSTVCGTWAYCAPEVIAGKPYTQSVDNWTLGVLTYVLLCGYHPFDVYGDLPEPKLLKRITECKYDFSDQVWTKVSKEAKSLIQGLLQVDPEKRLSLKDYLRSPWICQGSSLSHTPNIDVARRLCKLSQDRKQLRTIIIAKLGAKHIRRLVEKKRKLSRCYQGDEAYQIAMLSTSLRPEQFEALRAAGAEPSSPSPSQSYRGSASPLSPPQRNLSLSITKIDTEFALANILREGKTAAEDGQLSHAHSSKEIKAPLTPPPPSNQPRGRHGRFISADWAHQQQNLPTSSPLTVSRPSGSRGSVTTVTSRGSPSSPTRHINGETSSISGGSSVDSLRVSGDAPKRPRVKTECSPSSHVRSLPPGSPSIQTQRVANALQSGIGSPRSTPRVVPTATPRTASRSIAAMNAFANLKNQDSVHSESSGANEGMFVTSSFSSIPASTSTSSGLQSVKTSMEKTAMSEGGPSKSEHYFCVHAEQAEALSSLPQMIPASPKTPKRRPKPLPPLSFGKPLPPPNSELKAVFIVQES